MKVRMTRTALGSEDGAHVKQYEEGVEYDLPEDLARTFIESGAARPVESKPAQKPVSRKKR